MRHPATLLPLVAAVCALAGAAPASAQDAAARPFQIPAGAAAAAVALFAKQADLRVLADGDDLAGIQTRAVQGSYAPGQALDLLLAGTGLSAVRNANGTALIRKTPAVPAVAKPAPLPALATPAVYPSQVLVVGTRAAQQTSLERKKHADTAIDSIIAEDVGVFPDRNVAEALSRIAGVALDRGDYGEGTTVTIRGNPAETIRLEIDGLGVQAAGGTDLNNGGSGRGVDLRELSTDLIKSIDVVKGATVDMTEGSLGGGVIIHTRSGLDFNKQYVALRLAGQENSINTLWTPNLNFVFADKFLDKRLGVLFGVTSSAAHNENHTAFISTRDAGLSRDLDFDNSPDKTFSYNPSTISTTNPAATAPLASWPTTGGGKFDALSPLDIITRSAAAQTKADCYAAFPLYTSAQVAAISTALGRGAARNQRAGELQSCLNQWNDYAPPNLRYQIRREFDRRQHGDLRLDFKVDDRLSVYAKVNKNTRRINDDQLYLSLGGISINLDGSYTDVKGASGVTRTPLAGSGYYWYPSPSNLGLSGSTYQGLTDGSVANVLPSSLVVDANHHVVQYTLSNAAVNDDQIYDQIESSSLYREFGGNWRAGALQATFLAGRTSAQARRMQWRTNFNFSYGPATASLLPDGLWGYSASQGVPYNQFDPNNYGILKPAVDASSPLRSASTQLTLANPRLMERGEDTARIDLSWSPRGALPFLGKIKFGTSWRDYKVASWSGAGYTVQPAADGMPAVVVPRVAVGSSFLACEDTAASLSTGGQPCKYGATASSNPATAFNSTIVMTQADYRNIVAQALGGSTVPYFNSLPNIPAGLVPGWTEIDVRKVIEATGVQHFNLDCIQFCTASDGKVYAQPMTAVRERVAAGYWSADFGIDRVPFTSIEFPFGWRLDGNFGWRVVRTRVAATGLMTFQTTTKTAAYDPLTPDAAAGIVTRSLTRNTTTSQRSTDVMPILNLAWWPVHDKLVLRFTKAKQIARPPVEALYSDGVTCKFDQRKLVAGSSAAATDPADMACDGTLGNPGLRPLTNRNYNLSAEWYPNRDTILTVSGFRQEGLVGAPVKAVVANARPFADAGTVDPNSGTSLASIEYGYTTWVNGPPIQREGFEIGAKTSFGFLPGLLRHTGIDLDYTRVHSNSLDGAVRDLLTGDVMSPAGEPKYTWNTSLWYDDGKLQARVALQSTATLFRNLSSLRSGYPANGVVLDNALPLNPGSPTFREGTRFIDAKVSYKFANGIEFFVEGRNLGRATVANSQGSYVPYADGTPNLLDYSYSGAQYMVGLTIRR